jgi:hypothetical protein
MEVRLLLLYIIHLYVLCLVVYIDVGLFFVLIISNVRLHGNLDDFHGDDYEIFMLTFGVYIFRVHSPIL